MLAALGGGAAGAVLGGILPGRLDAISGNWTSQYVADGTAGLTAAFPLSAVRLLDSPMRANQARNTNYLMFVDPDRMLHTFRLNYGLPSSARPCGGWERPGSLVRGHCTGHLMSGLALTYASTGNRAAADKGAYLVDELARCQARDRAAGFHDGYLSAFPETFFDRLEAGLPVWSPYYMIHKIMAGLIDQHELAGNSRALEVAARLGDWVGWRTGRLSYAHMQRILETEHGGIAESLANLYRLTWDESYLRTAERFYHARVFDPLARGQDDLQGLHANTNIPKMIACIRIWEETGDLRYHDIARQLLADRHRPSRLRHRRHQQLRALARTRRDRRAAEQPDLRELLQLQHAEADPAAALPPAAPGGPARLLRADAVQPDARRAGPAVRARLQHLLHGPVTGRLQAAATVHGHQPGRLLDQLPQFLLRRRDRDGDPGQVRGHHLLAGHPRAVRQPVHPVRGLLGRGRGDDPPGHRVPGRGRHPPHGRLRVGPDGPADPAAGLAGRPAARLGEWRAAGRPAHAGHLAGHRPATGGRATGWT